MAQSIIIPASKKTTQEKQNHKIVEKMSQKSKLELNDNCKILVQVLNRTLGKFSYQFVKMRSLIMSVSISFLVSVFVLFFALGLGFSFATLTPLTVNAQSNGNTNGNGGQEPIVPSQSQICGGDACPVLDVGNVRFATKEDFADFIIRIAQFLTYIGVALAVLFLVIGGIQFMLGKSDMGWKTINTTLIGVVVIIVSYTAVALITQFLTGDLLGQTITGTGVGTSASSSVR